MIPHMIRREPLVPHDTIRTGKGVAAMVIKALFTSVINIPQICMLL